MRHKAVAVAVHYTTYHGVKWQFEGQIWEHCSLKTIAVLSVQGSFSWWKLWAPLCWIDSLSIQDDKWFEDIWLLSIGSKNCLINQAQLVPCSQVSVRIKPNTYRLQGCAPRRVQIGSHWATDLIPAAAFRFIPLWICPDCQDTFYIFLMSNASRCFMLSPYKPEWDEHRKPVEHSARTLDRKSD